MTDTFKQLRSMILLEMCCPPLPVMAVRQETGEDVVTNTHDMMSVFMIAAFKRQDGVENERRKEKQLLIEKTYQDGLEKCDNFMQAYSHMAQFSVDYLATYLLPGAGYSKQDIRILPPGYISPHLKEEIRSYCRALRLLAEIENNDNLSDYSVDALLMSCVLSAIHKKQQCVVGVPVLVGVGDDVGEESHDPQALEASVEVLGYTPPVVVHGSVHHQDNKQDGGEIDCRSE